VGVNWIRCIVHKVVVPDSFDYVKRYNLRTTMKVFISYKADYLNKDIEHASLTSQPEVLRKIYASIEAADRIWATWAMEHGGKVLSAGDGAGKLEMPGEYVHEVPKLKEQYAGAIDSSISVGIGARIDEADLALKAAGKAFDKIMLYGPDVLEVLKEEELTKADPPSTPQDFYVPVASKAGAPKGADSSPAEAPEAPQEPHSEPGQSAPDLHEQLGKLATGSQQQQAQAQQDQDQQSQQQNDADNLKQQVVQALKTFQDRREELEAVAKQDPDLYKSLVVMIQSMIAMSRQVFGGEQEGEPTQKSEDLSKVAPPGFSEETMHELKRKHGVESAFKIAWAAHKKLKAKKSEKIEVSPEGHFEDGKKLVKDLLPGGAADDADPREFNFHELEVGIAHEMEHTNNKEIATEIAMDHLRESPTYYSDLRDIEKAALEAGKTGKHRVVLPVGSTKEPHGQGTRDAGKIKVLDSETGKEKWRQVRSGIVMAPDGTPTSSRKPNG
jgi:hypothetical protein